MVALLSSPIIAQNIEESQGENGKWEVTATFSEKEWPDWLSGSNYDAEAKIAVNQKGEIFIVLLETLDGTSGHIDGSMFVVSPDGKLLAQKNNAFKWDSLSSIHDVNVDSEGNFWISVQKGIPSYSGISMLYQFSPQLNELSHFEAPPAQLFFWQDKMLLGINRNSKVLGDSILLNDDNPYTLLMIDYQNNTIVSQNPLPATGTGSNSFFVSNPDGSFYYVLNTTVLEYMDHHDVHLFSFSEKGVLNGHRQLQGQSGMAYLFANEINSTENGELKISGNSDSPVDFAKKGEYIADSVCQFFIYDSEGNEIVMYLPLKEANQAKDTLGEYELIINGEYNFVCTYSNKMELIDYTLVSNLYRFYIPKKTSELKQFNSPELRKYGKIKYNIFPAPLESTESPVFKLYREE